MSVKPGLLYVVATPIGNLGDITVRAQQILTEVDFIAAEDTRRTRPLLQHLGISKAIVSIHEHNERQRVDSILARVLAGESSHRVPRYMTATRVLMCSTTDRSWVMNM